MKDSLDKLIVFVAQGFGIGRIPFAPGTWGSILGAVWFYVLAWTDWAVIITATILSILLAVLFCGEAARLLGKDDPPSIVLDEIVAVPVSCFLLFLWLDRPPLMFFERQWSIYLGGHPALCLGICFVLFRLFDIWKPWPIRQSQRLPGGWGIVMDDVLAAAYVNLVVLAAHGVLGLLAI